MTSYRILIKIFFLIFGSMTFTYGQFGRDTITYKWTGETHGPFLVATIISFYPDSIFIREDYNIDKKNQSLNKLVPEKEIGKWRIKGDTIIINHDLGKDNSYYYQYKIRKNSIKWIPNPRMRLDRGYLKYKWFYWTKAMKLKRIKKACT